jgi:hypothetical protein
MSHVLLLLQKLCDWLNATQKTSTAFDFPTKGILQVGLQLPAAFSATVQSCIWT